MNLQIVLSSTFILSLLPGIFFLTRTPAELIEISPLISAQKQTSIPEISLSTPLSLPEFPTQTALEQLTFSVNPPRPSHTHRKTTFRVHFAHNQEPISVVLPTRIGLRWSENTELQPNSSTELFWLQLDETSAGNMSASLSYRTPAGETVLVKSWVPTLEETPLQGTETFSPPSPFAEFAQCRFGPDVLAEKYGHQTIYRLEVSSNSFPIKPDEWLMFKNQKWQPLSDPKDTGDAPIARLKYGSFQQPEFEGWEGSSYVRFQLRSQSVQPLKVRGDELFTQLRVRSENQVSCMLDKQCLVLKPGDWVLKMDNRWKVLRKAEEKKKVLEGGLVGDLIVLDRVEARNPTKSVFGHYVAANRLQCTGIEKSVTTTRRK